jgi:hypothetical protein
MIDLVYWIDMRNLDYFISMVTRRVLIIDSFA